MTIAGVLLLTPELAIVWVDTTIFNRGGAPIGHANKLALNALAGVVGVGTGWSSVVGEARDVIANGLDAAQIVARLPRRLRRCAGEQAATREHSSTRHTFADNAVGLAGYSPRAGRVLAWVAPALANFEPGLRERWAVPEPPDFGAFAPEGPADVAALAMRQVAMIGCDTGDAGVLQIVSVTHAGITTYPAFDLTAGVFLRCPRSLAPVRDRRAAAEL